MESIAQLAGGVAHDFNNALTSILGFTELALSNTSTDGENAAYLEEIRRSGQGAAKLVSQLLTYSRSDPYAMTYRNVDELIPKIAPMLRGLVPESIDIEMQEGVRGTALIDAAEIERVIVNLVINAKDAMPDGGLLSIRTETMVLPEARTQGHRLTAGTYHCISITDNGCGIEHALLSKVTEPFFSTKPIGLGTGLGLSVTQSIVAAHGGFMEIESVLGEGTSVRLYFPESAGDNLLREERIRFEAAPTSGTVLVVEDGGGITRLLTIVLSEAGYTVMAACNGAQGLLTYHENRELIDLVLTDVVMPEVGGEELYRSIRAAGGEVPFLFMTGYSGGDRQANFLTQEGLDVLRKPFMPDEVVVKINELMAARNDA